jgi:large subunit ribosomal protein L23
VDLDAFQIIKSPLITEKVTGLTEHANVYAFKVDMRANKVQIRTAVQKLWPGVKVLSVRTQVRKGKPRRMKHNWSAQPNWKRAMVRLAEGQRIEG